MQIRTSKERAYLAADRSMRAAQASEDPVTTGASARIITHTLMNGGHLAAAIDTAGSQAARLDRDVPSHTPESLSVYGSLLLRGAIAAAQHGNRGAAYELLTEADAAGRRLGVDGNLRWTAFGPTNAKLHRVNIAVTLGDAGTVLPSCQRTCISATSAPDSQMSPSSRLRLSSFRPSPRGRLRRRCVIGCAAPWPGARSHRSGAYGKGWTGLRAGVRPGVWP